MSARLTLLFDSDNATLATAGGKGVNLVRLARAGFSVPPGFIVTTAAYRSFVSAHDLTTTITTALTGLRADDAAALERSSTVIRTAFRMGKVPETIAADVRSNYARLGAVAVAVRSSATAEDLPDLSFAGQQDTFLNVIGPDALLSAVVDCWSSLWSARAIGYRLRNDIDNDSAALAVVVQAMAPATSSGVLFTANPLTGHRGQTVIDATLGLGEALVSGLVEPDHFVVETATGASLTKMLGRKQVATRPRPEGGVEVAPTPPDTRFALSDQEVAQLVELGRRVQDEYGAPQDIEWALADSEYALLQSRAITSLFPLPHDQTDAARIWFSFGAVQGMLDPITPLGRDTLSMVLAGGARAFGARLDYRAQDVLVSAGERLWVRIDGVLRHPLGLRAAEVALPMVEPSTARIVDGLLHELGIGAGGGRIRVRTMLRLAGFALRSLARMTRSVFFPERARASFDARIADELERGRRALDAVSVAEGDPRARLGLRLKLVQSLTENAFSWLLPRFIPILGPSMGMLRLLTEIAAQVEAGEHGVSALALQVTRGLPGNVTTEMDLALWRTAETIGADAAARQAIQTRTPQALAEAYLSGALPPVAQAAVADFLAHYGMRGVAEIDLGRPTWFEEPAGLFQLLNTYLQINDPERAPDTVFQRGQVAAEAAVEELAEAARRQPGGWIKSRLVRFAARRIRQLLGARESPKFFAIRMMGAVRAGLQASGHDLVSAGLLARPDDIFFLHFHELQALASGETDDAHGVVLERRALYARELRRRQIPRVLVGDGRAFYEGLGATATVGEALTGSPVSPGIAEGVVRVVLDPHVTQLLPGEILVCPGTDPAWTPLFMAAAGLVTEVGGMMTHGSVVAREYGIPAVVGVHQATIRLKTGQRIRIDGTQGTIAVLD